MEESIGDKFTRERSLLYILLGGVLIVIIILFYLFFVYGRKGITITSPNGREEWQISETYEITWKARKVGRVGIVLFNETEPKWIAKNIDASQGKYKWKIYPGQSYGDGFWMAIFEYPWKDGNSIDYSNGAFAITYPELSACDTLSFENEWPFLPSNFPNIRKVFITEENFDGNLEGLDGADKKCQEEADSFGFEGTWRAFLGGESDQEIAVERLKKTPRGTDGIFAQADISAILVRGDTCHRLVAKDFNEFLMRLSDSEEVNSGKLDQDFLEKIKEIWLGRVDGTSNKNCISMAKVMDTSYGALAEKYSYTTTCQNWTRGEKFVGGYPVRFGDTPPEFALCFTDAGQATNAVASGGLASGLDEENLTIYQGKYCNDKQKLLCIQE